MLRLSFLFLLSTISTALAAQQCLTVLGQVKCGSRVADKPVFIKLLDEDSGGPDDWMDEGYASKSGYFYLHGCASDPFGMTIDPMLRIYHTCKGVGYRRTIRIPKAVVKSGIYKFNTTIDLSSDDKTDEKHKYQVTQCSKLETSTGKPK
ncbi:Transthyretin-like protein 46 [Trichuris trichiura]|uniref:Transthyretin-like protein 46 n=1 Tax=Trichuris trichiura TaxID=36087 RepID=A0A077Z9N4_TRITR|nr:Transthyretin-like protein 46 [Trichuris trichiura]